MTGILNDILLIIGGLGIGAAGFFGIQKANAAPIVSDVRLEVSAIHPHTANDLDVMARTIWGEARGEGKAGMEAVANVIMNRYARRPRFGKTVANICQKPYQFSAWLVNDPNYKKMVNVTRSDEKFDLAYKIAEKALSGQLKDKTGGADHYHASYVNPYWASMMQKTKSLSNHIFYREA